MQARSPPCATRGIRFAAAMQHALMHEIRLVLILILYERSNTMKRYLAAACVLPFALGSAVYAQGTKGPSGSGAENPSKQSRVNDQDESRTSAQTDRASDRDRTRTTETNSSPASATDAASPGNQGGTSSVAPQEAPTPRTTEPSTGHNRSASGNSAQTNSGTQGAETTRSTGSTGNTQ